MNVKPILFSAPMICALLDGRKTQTRRIMKPQPIEISGLGKRIYPDEDWKLSWGELRAGHEDCQYGKVGDLLWVRETYNNTCGELLYKADNVILGCAKWKPSIYMPRHISRLTLKITGIRVEKLHSISERDAIAEGLINTCDHTFPKWTAGDGFPEHFEFPIGAYKDLWQSINGDGSWDLNPWVWVLEFEVIEQNIDEYLRG